jgi:hypothetical protein
MTPGSPDWTSVPPRRVLTLTAGGAPTASSWKSYQVIPGLHSLTGAKLPIYPMSTHEADNSSFSGETRLSHSGTADQASCSRHTLTRGYGSHGE